MTPAEKSSLIDIARETIRATVLNTRPLLSPIQLVNTSYGGAFVTLRSHGVLRGCMGTFDPDPDVAVMIQRVAQLAAQDPRFIHHPLDASELNELTLEISLLSKPQPTSNPLSLEVGKHGIMISHPGGRGCFLPQVAAEMGWSAQQFLTQCCQQKAGIAAEAWKTGQATVHLFTCEVIQE